MLRYFFEIGAEKTLFDGLYISQNEQFCEEYMGKFPVVFLTLKGVDGTTFEEARRFKFLLESNKLDDDDKEMYRELISLNKSQNPVICQMRSIWKFMTGCTNGIKSFRN